MKVFQLKAFLLFVLATISLGLCDLTAVAQLVDTGSIVGTVHDPSGAVISGAKVTIRNLGSNAEVVVNTNADGEYVVSSLKVGKYSLRVEANGFQTFLQSGIVVHVQARAEGDVTLRVGQTSQVVNVNSDVSLLDTQTANVGQIEETKRTQDLPLNGRQYDTLVLLASGASPEVKNMQARGEGMFSINGNTSVQNNFILDGVDNNSFSTNLQEQSTQVVQPPVDSLEEFKLQTRTYDAEFGRNAGGVINATIKSGTNQMHGGAYEFFRNRKLDANDWFLNSQGKPRPKFQQNQYGGNLGGPILKDRLFVFGAYEHGISNKGLSETGTVPTPLMTQSLTFTELPVQPHDPAGLPQFQGCINGGIVKPSCVDPTAAKVFALYPGPNANQSQAFKNASFNFISSPTETRRSDSGVIRVDEKLGERDLFTEHYAIFDLRQFIPGIFALVNPIADGASDTTLGFNNDRGHSVAFGWTHIFSPALLNDFRFGFNRIASHSLPASFGQIVNPQFGVNGVPVFPGVSGGLPEFDINGFQQLGSPRWLPQNQFSQVWQYRDVLTYIKGSHTIKAGFEVRRDADNFLDICCQRGFYNFNSQYTGAGITDFLLGLPSSTRLATNTIVHEYQDGYSGFVQDTWRVAPNVTLNYGLRLEYATPTIERENHITNFDPNGNGGQGALFSVPADASDVQTRTTIRRLPINWAPRAGLSYRIRNKLVFRTGGGLFYELYDRRGSESNLSLNPPFLVDHQVQNSPSAAPAFLLKDGFPSTFLNSPALNNLSVIGQLFLRLQNQNLRPGRIQQYSAGFEYSITPDLLVDASWVGNYGSRLWRLVNLNQGILVTPGQPGFTVPFPQFLNGAFPTSMEFLTSSGSSTYNAVQLKVEKRFSHGLSFLVSFTGSKYLADFTSNLIANAGTASLGRASTPQDSHNLGAERGLAPEDTTKRIVTSFSYELPVGRGKTFASSGVAGRLLERWQVNGIVTFSDGQPVEIGSPVDTSHTQGDFRGAARANCNTQPAAIQRTVNEDFDTSAFTVPADNTFGNCGVAPFGIRTRGVNNWDLSLFKDIPLNERFRAQFRAEFFNAVNHPQFGAPGLVVTGASFGRISSVAVSPRQIQFALKVAF